MALLVVFVLSFKFGALVALYGVRLWRVSLMVVYDISGGLLACFRSFLADSDADTTTPTPIFWAG